MSGPIPKAIIPPPPPPAPRQTLGHLIFLKMIDQIPRYMGRFQGQMPHWLGLKSQNFHNLSGKAQRLKTPDKNCTSMHPMMDPKSLCTCAGDFLVSKDLTRLSVHGVLFCVVCLLPIILRRDNFKLAL